jgi:transcriptional antiterminator RfaH
VEMENAVEMPRWYAINTKPREEDRVDRNLTAWGVETFAPRVKQKRFNQFTGKATGVSQPLFPRYIFARFDVNKLLHKVYYTRGVRSVVSFNGSPVQIEDKIIELIQSQVDKDGFVQLGGEFKHGDEVMIRGGSLKGLNGIFERDMKDSGRVMILLRAINYQASIVVEKALVQKADQAVCFA